MSNEKVEGNNPLAETGKGGYSFGQRVTLESHTIVTSLKRRIRMSKRNLFILVLVVAVAMLFVFSATAAPTKVGADKCKMCHKVQYDSWAASKHAAATPQVDCEH